MKHASLIIIICCLFFTAAGCGDGDGIWSAPPGAGSGGPGAGDDAPGGGDDPSSPGELADIPSSEGNGSGEGSPSPNTDGGLFSGLQRGPSLHLQIPARGAVNLLPQVKVTATSCRGSSDPLCQDPRIKNSKNLTVVKWSLKNVSAAFMSIRPRWRKQYHDPFAYTSFIGDPHNPYLGKRADPDIFSIVDDLLASPLSKFGTLSQDISGEISDDTKALPFNYCMTRIPGYRSASCFTRGETPLNYLAVFFPLRENEISRSGTWLMSIEHGEHGFEVFYRGMLNGNYTALTVTNDGVAM